MHKIYKFWEYLGNCRKFILRNKERKFWQLQNFIKEKPYEPKTFVTLFINVVFNRARGINWTIIRLV